MGKSRLWDLGVPNFRSARQSWKGTAFFHLLLRNGRLLLPWGQANKVVMG